MANPSASPTVSALPARTGRRIASRACISPPPRGAGTETLSTGDHRALERSLRLELDMPDVALPTKTFLPSLSDLERDLRAQEDSEEAFGSILSFAVPPYNRPARPGGALCGALAPPPPRAAATAGRGGRA